MNFKLVERPKRGQHPTVACLLEQGMILGQLLGIPEGELVPHRGFGHLIFGQGLDFLVEHEQSVDEEESFAHRVLRFEDRGLALFRVFHTGK
jgi:hypothetical protein